MSINPLHVDKPLFTIRSDGKVHILKAGRVRRAHGILWPLDCTLPSLGFMLYTVPRPAGLLNKALTLQR